MEDSVAAAQAVLGGKSAQETQAIEQQLQASTVTHLTYEELTDTVTEQGLDLQNAFIPETIEMANNSHDEQWRMQWDAVQNMRILNKFHYSALENFIDQQGNFIKAQVENLRSNNNRNALCLFAEIFSSNHEKCPEGKKVNDTWAVFLDVTFATIFAKAAADKKFLSLMAQKGI